VVRLSVNVNKVATLRNARGGWVPSVCDAVRVCVDAGALGITVHPRADQRHITAADVREIANLLTSFRGRVELNIEGDPRPGFLALVRAVRPDQCTLVPVRPGEVTSKAGWPASTASDTLATTLASLRSAGTRVSLFVDPEPRAIRWAAGVGADRVELYTEPFARACSRSADEGRASFGRYAEAACLALELGLGINAGHDLDLSNLPIFLDLPGLAEVSIGHALISHALFVGLDRAVRDYRAVLAAA
jgi:pyridoxine 5-phosphate synthase